MGFLSNFQEIWKSLFLRFQLELKSSNILLCQFQFYVKPLFSTSIEYEIKSAVYLQWTKEHQSKACNYQELQVCSIVVIHLNRLHEFLFIFNLNFIKFLHIPIPMNFICLSGGLDYFIEFKTISIHVFWINLEINFQFRNKWGILPMHTYICTGSTGTLLSLII